MSNRIKVCIGMLVTVILTCLLFWLAPPTVVIPTLGVTTFVAVSALLWSIFLRNKRLMTIILIGSLLSIPVYQPKAQPSKDNLLIACFVASIGAIFVAGMWYACKKLPPPPGTCPCGCGVQNCPCSQSNNQNFAAAAPPTYAPAIVTNPPAAGKNSLSNPVNIHLPQIAYVSDVLTNGTFLDYIGQPWAFHEAWSFTLQSSTNLSNWNGIYTFNGWNIDGGGTVVSVLSNNVPIYNAYFTVPNNPNNTIPLEFVGPLKQKEFFRVICQE